MERKVYLPAGCDWYNFWTNERLKGGQTITASAPIDTLPLFVRAGSILPLGTTVENTQQEQAIAKVRIYPGANAAFNLFTDDGTSYAYEKDGGKLTELHWDEATKQLRHKGAAAWKEPDAKVIEVVGR